MNGLNIGEKEFFKLPVKRQNTILFSNTEEIKVIISKQNDIQDSFKFQQKIQWTAISAIAVFLGISKYLGVM